jgi:chorismate mutase
VSTEKKDRPPGGLPHLYPRTRVYKSRLVLLQLALMIWGIKAVGSEVADPLRSLVETSGQRLRIAEKVALAKWDSDAPVEDAAREARVLQTSVEEGKARGLNSTHVEDFFRAQIEANKLVQYSLLAEWQREGGSPPHAAVNLEEIRPELDGIEKQLITELSAAVAARPARTCRRDVARLVGEYLQARKVKPETREAVALDRATAAVCIQ